VSETFVCHFCGFRGRAADGQTRCKSRNACRRRQAANVRLIGRFNGSIRYSGDTFDRVERLKALQS